MSHCIYSSGNRTSTLSQCDPLSHLCYSICYINVYTAYFSYQLYGHIISPKNVLIHYHRSVMERSGKQEAVIDDDDDDGPPPGWEFSSLARELPKVPSDTTGLFCSSLFIQSLTPS